jgi:hypothetical protein
MKNTPFNNLLKLLLFSITTARHFLTKDFLNENYYKHFFASIVIAFLVQFSLDFSGVVIWFQLFVGYLIGYGVNFSREWYYSKYKKAPFSFQDIIFGGYGGIIGSLILILTR